MGEIYRRTRSEAALFTKSIGYPIGEQNIIQTYPIHFKDRLVVRVIDNQAPKKHKVLKIRPLDEKAIQECRKVHLLFACYRFSGGSFPTVEDITLNESNHMIFKMTYLGPNLGELASELDLLEMGYLERSSETFQGFSSEEITKLVDNLNRSHLNFANKHGCIHGDILQQGSPNNIVYHPKLNRLFFVDAEALTTTDNYDNLYRFRNEIELVEEWMHRSLLKSN